MNSLELTTTQALRLWHDVSVGLVTDGKRDLTQRQLAILLKVYLEPPPHTVRALASDLSVTKPVITRALDTMGRMGLLDRKRDDKDKRNVIIQRTVDGTLFLDELADLVVAQAKGLKT